MKGSRKVLLSCKNSVWEEWDDRLESSVGTGDSRVNNKCVQSTGWKPRS